jgi:hypothetical protein
MYIFVEELMYMLTFSAVQIALVASNVGQVYQILSSNS